MSPLNMFIELLETLPVVFSLYVCTIVFSVPLGILGALAYTGKNKIVKSILSVYTWVFMGNSPDAPAVYSILWNSINKFLWI